MNTINLEEKFSRFSDYYNPRILGEVNDCHVKAVKLKDEFIWHHHENEDELFLVVKGALRMKFRDHEAVVREGEIRNRPARRGALPRRGRGSSHRAHRAEIHFEYRKHH